MGGGTKFLKTSYVLGNFIIFFTCAPPQKKFSKKPLCILKIICIFFICGPPKKFFPTVARPASRGRKNSWVHPCTQFFKEYSYISVARSSAQAEYHAIVYTVCKILWLRQLLGELRYPVLGSIIYDRLTAIHVASNLVFHDHKHIEVFCCFIKEKY